MGTATNGRYPSLAGVPKPLGPYHQFHHPNSHPLVHSSLSRMRANCSWFSTGQMDDVAGRSSSNRIMNCVNDTRTQWLSGKAKQNVPVLMNVR